MQKYHIAQELAENCFLNENYTMNIFVPNLLTCWESLRLEHGLLALAAFLCLYGQRGGHLGRFVFSKFQELNYSCLNGAAGSD